MLQLGAMAGRGWGLRFPGGRVLLRGVVGTIVSILLSGLLIGGLARWAVPGPDPMPVWLTILFGLLGSTAGAAAVTAFLGTKDVSSSDYFSIVMAEIVATILLLVAYRRFVQGRPITGPEAHKPPTRGIGIRGRRAPGSRPTIPGLTPPSPPKVELLRKIDELHDAGVLTDEEYVEKRRAVLAQD